tara:strand:- start:2854 stop:3465 length:612 start_codon:yes stop_codon:yes gene_type:complete
MKIICIGQNYLEHIKELSNVKSKEPLVFLKPDTSLIPKDRSFFIPNFSNEIHYELEVVIKVKKPGRYIERKYSSQYYDEITLGIDFTARDLQKKLREKGHPWEKSKSFDGSTLVGNFLNKNDLPPISNLNFHLLKNENTVQSENTKNMIWPIDELIEHISKFFTLKIGDLIFTGTPSGVGEVSFEDNLKGFLEGKELFEINVS